MRAAMFAFLLVSVLMSSNAAAQVLPPQVSSAPVGTFEYDAAGNLTRHIRGPDVATVNQYDRLSRPVSVAPAAGSTTRFDYNAASGVVQVTDPRNLVTGYLRDGLGNALRIDSPDTGSTMNSFDAGGRLKTRIDSRGVSAAYGYDALDRPTSVVYSQSGQASQTFTWRYDQSGTGFSHGIGRLTSTQFPSGAVTYAYDAAGRLLSTTQTVTTLNTVAHTTGYVYDAAGRIASVTYPSGRVLYISHVAGQPVSMSLASNGASAAQLLISGLQFEPNPGAQAIPRSWNWHLINGPVLHTRIFDVYGRMVRYPVGGTLRDLTFDAADRIAAYRHVEGNTGLATAAAAALDQTFGYDPVGRLTSVNTGVGAWTFGYDANGNRTHEQTSSYGARVHHVAGDSNRLLALSNPTRNRAHDVAGNTISDYQGNQGWTAGFDLAGRMSSLYVSVNGSVVVDAMYAYNGAGQRVAKRVRQAAPPPGDPGVPMPSPGGCRKVGKVLICGLESGTTTGSSYDVVYVYDQSGQLLGEYSGSSGAALREYIWLQDIPLAVLAYDMATPANPTPVFYIQADHLNTPRVVLDSGGTKRWSWMAEPFGNSHPNTNPVGAGAFTLNLRMPGQYYDSESGLSYNWHRSLDASLGRYTQSDPIGLAGGINPYAYVEGDPVSFIDPLGLDRWGNTMCLPTHVYIVQSSGNGKHGPTWGAAGSASNSSAESPAFMTFPANSFPDVKYGSPGIVDGTYYGTYGRSAHGFPGAGKRGPGIVLNNNGPIPTLGPNPVQGNLHIADYVHMHCQNYGQSRSDSNRGSAGCITARGDYCERLWRTVENQCNKNVIVHVIRN